MVRNRQGLYLDPSGRWTTLPDLAWQCQVPEAAALLLRDGVFGDPGYLRLECITLTTYAHTWNWRAHDPASCP